MPNKAENTKRRRRSRSSLNYILGIAALSVFQFVIVCLRRHRTKYWTEILQYDLLRECERAGRGEKEKRDSCVCTAASSCCQKFQRKWIRLWHSILYFGYPLLWQTQAECCYDLPAEGICNGTLRCLKGGEEGGGKTIVLELHKQKIFKSTATLWQILSCLTAEFVVLLIGNLNCNCIIYFRI